MKTMNAMVIDRYGGPEEFRMAEVPMPKPKRGEVLVRTKFIGVNPKDVLVRKGKFRILTGKRFPLIMGHDIAGEVVESTAGSDLSVGELVYGMINDFAGRAYAEYVSIAANQVARVPKSIDLGMASAVPLAAQTGLQALVDDADLKPGQRVIINGASGGVGTFAVQIAKSLGAHVTAVCSDRNTELVQSLGADEVVDYRTQELVKLSERYDVFFDVFGNYNFGRISHLLDKDGRYVHTIPNATIFKEVAQSFFSKKKAKIVIVRSRRKQLDWLTQKIDSGEIRVVVDKTFSLNDAADAHRYMETKRARGKVVLSID